MFYIPFWIYIAAVAILAGVTIAFRKLKFIDIQAMILVIAVSMSCDMIFCKQLALYHYVDMSMKYIGWYSFWANSVGTSAIGLVFVKFLPYKKVGIAIYIAAWTAALTLLESCILKPSGILHTMIWQTVPWSVIGYLLVLILLSYYYRTLEKRIA